MAQQTRTSTRFNHGSAGRSRSGVTLLELMLVLALLVMIGALALPTFRGPFANQKLRKSGDVVRIAWNKARIKAMKTGQIQMFKYDVEKGTFSTQPYYSEQDMLEADAMHSGVSTPGSDASGSVAVAQQMDATFSQPKNLPDGVVFAAGEVDSDMRSMQVQQEMQSGQSGGAMAAGGMASGGTGLDMASQYPPILFYPDGTTSNARLTITDQRQQYYVIVTLRSLTGIAKVSDLVTANEMQMVPQP